MGRESRADSGDNIVSLSCSWLPACLAAATVALLWHSPHAVTVYAAAAPLCLRRPAAAAVAPRNAVSNSVDRDYDSSTATIMQV